MSLFYIFLFLLHSRNGYCSWCLRNLMFRYQCFLLPRKEIYMFFFTNVCKPFKTCIILLSTWYGNQCRMLNLLCQAVCCRKKMLYQISTHSQHFKKPIFYVKEWKIYLCLFLFYEKAIIQFSNAENSYDHDKWHAHLCGPIIFIFKTTSKE